jgi:3-hydroxybutyryl-CoA dehydrogenase
MKRGPRKSERTSRNSRQRRDRLRPGRDRGPPRPGAAAGPLEDSAERARATVEKTLGRLGAEVDPEHVQIVTDPQALAEATFVVEAVVEDHDVKAGLLAELDAILGPEAILASTTSSLSVERLAQESGRPERFVGLHVFNPVTKMKLVELIFPSAASEDTRGGRSRCARLREDPRRGPRRAGLRRQPPAVPVPVQRGAPARRDGHGPGGRRHLHAARRRASDGTARAARPVGLDVSKAIGETIGETIPARVES